LPDVIDSASGGLGRKKVDTRLRGYVMALHRFGACTDWFGTGPYVFGIAGIAYLGGMWYKYSALMEIGNW